MIPEIFNETNIETPEIDFFKLKNKILGESFDLTISFLLPKNSLKINKKQRKQSYIPNTLSFKYSDNSGEIILTPETILQESYDFLSSFTSNEQNFATKILYLIIHSMLHLTDLDHGPEMEQQEVKFFNEFTK